jgi:tetratricopeptide (TPR) repeat protein
MNRRELWRERWLPVLGFPGLLAAIVIADQTWLSPARTRITWSDATAFWEQQVQRRPGYGTSQLRLAVAYATEKRWPEALEVYDRALRADPDLEEAASGRATALSELGRGGEGRADLEQFYRDHPLCALCALSLALWDDAAGDRNRAVSRAERAAELAAARSERVLEHDGWLVAAQLVLDRDPARSLALAERALAVVPGSAGAAQLAAEARARLGRGS